MKKRILFTALLLLSALMWLGACASEKPSTSTTTTTETPTSSTTTTHSKTRN